MGAFLNNAKMDRADVRSANLTNASVTGVTWVEARFDRQTVWPESFDPLTKGMYGPGVNYANQNLSGKGFYGQDFYGANFTGANLQG